MSKTESSRGGSGFGGVRRGDGDREESVSSIRTVRFGVENSLRRGVCSTERERRIAPGNCFVTAETVVSSEMKAPVFSLLIV